MNWTEVNIYTTTVGIDILCARLMDLGIKGFVINDPNDFNAFLQDKEGHWDYIDEDLMKLSESETSVTVYIQENSQGAEMLAALKSEIKRLTESDEKGEFGRLDISMSSVREEDWANNWKQYFKPLKIGNNLLIKPSWEEYENIDNRLVLEIDPASSFGTGQHNTTRLCMELMEDVVKYGDKILDLGCGSGILSIAGVLLGAESVVAVDIEENSINTTIENFKKNNISSDKYNVYCGNIIVDKEIAEEIGTGFDLITANIVADVLIAMSELFKMFLKQNGTLIVSGIIEGRKDEVIDAITNAGFSLIDYKEKDDWIAARFILN
ncbi:MAG: 50S ribosomal protein L11 methyltransferase [Clostridiales bacterium]|jgi:ribosomal protein L11 methyltransferase|nr:50S ribosomal protein L11 methyltransferase [Clostridiales bacterium]